MNKFSGTITDTYNGNKFDVVGEWEAYITPDDFDAWRGWVKTTTGQGVPPNRYELTFPDGKKTVILVDHGSNFDGTGPTP